MKTADDRLAAIAQAAAGVLRQSGYAAMRVEDVAAQIRLPSGRGRPRQTGGGRSPVWLYGEIRAKRVLASLAAAYAWNQWVAERDAKHSDPVTVTDARAVVVAAFTAVAEFCRSEHPLMAEVKSGLGDLLSQERRGAAGDTRPASWSADSPYAVVVREAWLGNCAVFADFLESWLRRASEVVAPPEDYAAVARKLSNLAMHVCVDEFDDSPEVIATGLAAYWFDRYLARGGDWIGGVAEAERQVIRARRGDRAPRQVVSAADMLVTELLGTSVLLRRAAQEADRADAEIETLLAGRYASHGEPPVDAARDLMYTQTDVTSRGGLALLRRGLLDRARVALERSAALAADLPDTVESRIARAETNLADVDVQAGRGHRALDRIHRAVETRRALRDRLDTPTSWERLFISENAYVRALISVGRTGDGLRLARRVLDESTAHGIGVLTASFSVGRALQAVGRPRAAGTFFQQVRQTKPAGRPAYAFDHQEATLGLARCALDLRRPREALELLHDSPADSDWFADTVSPALAVEVRLASALALADAGDAEAGLAKAESARAAARQLLGERHPLVLDADRMVGVALLRAGRAAEARERLTAVHAAVADRVDPDSPVALRAAVSLLEAAEASGHRGEVVELYEQLAALGIDEAHPALVAGRLIAARTRLAEGADAAASALLRLVFLGVEAARLGDAERGEPAAIEHDHPLLLEARALEARFPRSAQEGRELWLSDE